MVGPSLGEAGGVTEFEVGPVEAGGDGAAQEREAVDAATVPPRTGEAAS